MCWSPPHIPDSQDGPAQPEGNHACYPVISSCYDCCSMHCVPLAGCIAFVAGDWGVRSTTSSPIKSRLIVVCKQLKMYYLPLLVYNCPCSDTRASRLCFVGKEITVVSLMDFNYYSSLSARFAFAARESLYSFKCSQITVTVLSQE